MAQARPVPQIPWGWRSMWVIVMFDLPNDTPKEKKAYVRFRKHLLEDGFSMMQYSVYIRHCASVENAAVHVKRMGEQVPAAGEVRFLTITDKQFSRIQIYVGKERKKTQPSPPQLELF